MLVIYHIWDKNKKSIWLQCKNGHWSRVYADHNCCTHIPLYEAMVQMALGVIPDPQTCYYEFRNIGLYEYTEREHPFTLVKVWYLK